MTFTTPTFLIFLAVVWSVYWMLGRRGQNNLILIASLVFYGWWDWRFLIMLLFIAGIDYRVALALMEDRPAPHRRFLLLVSLATNLGALAFFKYFNFFAASAVAALNRLGIPADPVTLQVILPVGISFYTFQALSYTIDVYRQQLPAVRDPIQYFCFITFFPHMVAGPIQQAKHLLVQFDRERRFQPDQAADGARQMLWGFFKKMVVADNLAPYVNLVYGDVGRASGWELLWATYFFAFQIYCDFSGYTDIAIGCARLFDLHMTRNFAYPYFSRSIPEFWRRWHISLSTWFREYLYIPLGGNRVSKARQQLNVLIVFVVSGFWHGANWTFLIWGFLHGIYYQAYGWMAGKRPIQAGSASGADTPGGERLIPTARDALAMVLTFHLVCLAWVFFRAASLPEALTILSRIGGAIASGAASLEQMVPVRGEDGRSIAAFVWVIPLLAVEWLQRARPHGLYLGAQKYWTPASRWVCYYTMVAVILMFAQLRYTPFIYFQF